MPDKETQTAGKEEEETTKEEEKNESERRVLAVIPRSRGFMPRPPFGAAALDCPAVIFPTSSDDPILASIPAYLRNPPVVRNPPRFPFTPPTPPPPTLPSTPDSPPSLTSSPPISPAAPPIFNLADNDDYAAVTWRRPLPDDIGRRLEARFARDFDPNRRRPVMESLRQDFLDTLNNRR